MAKKKEPQAYRSGGPQRAAEEDPEQMQVLELREEQLVANKDLRDMGEIVVRTQIDTLPGRLEVDAYREEVVVEHEPVGETVSERQEPWTEDDVLVMPIYEEQLVVTKRLVLRERIRVRRVASTERRLFQDTVRREQLLVEDPQRTGLVHERYPQADEGEAKEHHDDDGLLDTLVRKALQ